jgi:two-component system chemotaxis response regulator CheB
MARRIRILIVDDSALVRQLLTEIFAHDPALEVVGVAADPYAAWKKIKTLEPDVITLDVEMPRMDGVTFLERLMKLKPTPVLMVSSLTERGCDVTLRALEAGAIDFVTKPKIDVADGTVAISDELIAKVKAAASARIPVPRALAGSGARGSAGPVAAVRPAGTQSWTVKGTYSVVALGASTGGTEALKEILEVLPPDAPGIVIVQHMPEAFTRSFANRLNTLCRIEVHEAKDGDAILPGHALLAPGDQHMTVHRSGARYSVRLSRSEPVSGHRPSVDVLFHSCASALGKNGVGVIMTGMGRDGAAGLKAMRDAGAHTVAEDESSCVVFGMPREAIALGAAQVVAPRHQIAAEILRVAGA